VSPRTRASEFPNDNPSVSEGAIWICPEVRSRARSWFRPEFDPDVDPRLITLVGAELPRPSVEIAAREPVVEAAVETEFVGQAAPLAETEPGARDKFSSFASALADVALAHGASRAAACLPGLLGASEVPAGALGPELEDGLIARGVLGADGRKSDAFLQTSSAWRRVLSGETDDLSSCGTTTLDRFGAELLAALLGWPKSRVEDLRRELRRRGVAAFGVIADAA